MVTAIAKAGTVNLNRLAPHIESKATTPPVRRRLERFFTKVERDDAKDAHSTMAVLGIGRQPRHLAMNSTD